MASGTYIYMGLSMLIVIPVLMGFIGNTFEETITQQEEQTITNPLQDLQAEQDVGFFQGIWQGFKDLVTPDPTSWLGSVVRGYSIFPVWINLFITVLPLILLIRGVISTN